MLYPLTDNLLDDPGLDGGSKREFNERFGRRLAGLPVRPVGAREEAVFRLVARIEEEFPRPRFADVHASLLAIHRGQARSLLQQDAPEIPDGGILAISCEKGGSSVLADLYLVAGHATPSLERFAFGYGVFLQLLDDLQDVEADMAAGHQTLFTRAARRGPLDEATARLARFIDRVLDGAEILDGPGAADRKDLVRRSCRNLLVGAIADQPRPLHPRLSPLGRTPVALLTGRHPETAAAGGTPLHRGGEPAAGSPRRGLAPRPRGRRGPLTLHRSAAAFFASHDRGQTMRIATPSLLPRISKSSRLAVTTTAPWPRAVKAMSASF